jgi:uncharacterized protein
VLEDALPSFVGTLGAGVLFASLTRGVRLRWLAAAAAFLVAVDLVTRHGPPIPGSTWNWTGKLAVIAFSLVAMALLRLSRAEVGLVRSSGWRWTSIAIAVPVAFHVAMAVVFGGDGSASLETVLFQATMPGLAEELSFRGVAFALLCRAFPGQRVPAIAITALVFGLEHGCSFDHGGLQFFILPFAFALVLGLWFAAMRARTGSLLAPIVAHNAGNVLATVI